MLLLDLLLLKASPRRRTFARVREVANTHFFSAREPGTGGTQSRAIVRFSFLAQAAPSGVAAATTYGLVRGILEI